MLAVWERRLREILREDLETKHSTCIDFSDEFCLARLKVEVLSTLKGIRIGRVALLSDRLMQVFRTLAELPGLTCSWPDVVTVVSAKLLLSNIKLQ